MKINPDSLIRHQNFVAREYRRVDLQLKTFNLASTGVSSVLMSNNPFIILLNYACKTRLTNPTERKKIKMRYKSLLILIFLSGTIVNAQNEKGKWGFGAGGTLSNILSSEASSSAAGMGGEGIFSYSLSDKLSLNWIAGFNKFSTTPLAGASKAGTNLISNALTLEYEMKLMQSLRPFLAFGIGGHSFSVGGNNRFNDGESLTGGGLRCYMGKRTALYLAGYFKYTTGDALDGLDTGGRDYYYNLSAGIQFFRGHKKGQKIDDGKLTGTPFDKMPPVDSLLVEELSEDEKVAAAQQELAFSLSLKKEELEEKLANAEQEISRLQQEITEKSTEINRLQAAQEKPRENPPVPTEVTARYKNALALFHHKKYSDSNKVLLGLLEANPEHRLKSNFVYWIGENYFARKKYFQAAAEFEKVLGFAHSTKKDDSLMMLGRTYLQLGDFEAANSNFERLIVEFPLSEFKEKAEKYLQPQQGIPTE